MVSCERSVSVLEVVRSGFTENLFSRNRNHDFLGQRWAVCSIKVTIRLPYLKPLDSFVDKDHCVIFCKLRGRGDKKTHTHILQYKL